MNTPKPAPKKHSTLRVFLICLLAIALVGGGWLFYHYEQNNEAIAKERAQYAQAEKDMDTLASQIVTSLGQPDDSRTIKSCGYTSNSNEFERGDLYCSNTVELTYPVSNRESANQLTTNISNRIKSSSTFVYGDFSTALANISITPAELRSESFREMNGLKCSASYTYLLATDSTSGYSGIRSRAAQTLSLVMSCGSRPAKTAYYPITSD